MSNRQDKLLNRHNEVQLNLGPYLEAAAKSVMSQPLSRNLKTNQEILESSFNTIPKGTYDPNKRTFTPVRIGLIVDKTTLEIKAFSANNSDAMIKIQHGKDPDLIVIEAVAPASMLANEKTHRLLGTSATQFMSVVESHSNHHEVIRQRKTLERKFIQQPELAETRIRYVRSDGLVDKLSEPLELAALTSIFDNICSQPEVELFDVYVPPNGELPHSSDEKVSFFRIEQNGGIGGYSSYIAIPKELDDKLLNIAFSDAPDLGPDYHPNSRQLFNPNTEDGSLQTVTCQRTFGGRLIDIYASMLPLRDGDILHVSNKDTHAYERYVEAAYVKNLSNETFRDPQDSRNVFVTPQYEAELQDSSFIKTKTPIYGFRLAVSPSRNVSDEPLTITQQIRKRSVDGTLAWINYQQGTKNIPFMQESPHKEVINMVHAVLMSCIRTAESYLTTNTSTGQKINPQIAEQLIATATHDVMAEFEDWFSEIGLQKGYGRDIIDSIKNVITSNAKADEIMLSVNMKSQTPINRMVSSATLSAWHVCNRATEKEKQTIEAVKLSEQPSTEEPTAPRKPR